MLQSSGEQNVNHELIDLYYILHYPYALARISENVKLYIPDKIIAQADSYDHISGRKKNTFKNIIQTSIEKGFLQVIDVTDEELASENIIKKFGTLTKIDQSIIVAWQILNQEGISAIIISGSDRLVSSARNEGIQCRTIKEYKEYNKKNGYPRILYSDYNFEGQIIKTQFVERDRQLVRMVLGIVLGVLFIFIFDNLKTIVERLPEWLTLILFVALAMALFVFRERHRTTYGTTELVFGLGTLHFALHDFAFSTHNTTTQIITISFKILGSLYIMVRGLDNIHKGLSNSNLGKKINKIFRLN